MDRTHVLEENKRGRLMPFGKGAGAVSERPNRVKDANVEWERGTEATGRPKKREQGGVFCMG